MKAHELLQPNRIDWETELLTNNNLWVTQHWIRGSRVNGTHLVNARSKSEANDIVRALDPEFVKITSMPAKQWIAMFNDYEMAVPQNEKMPRPGTAEFIEAGT
jgi:hypothetical protein